MDILPDSRLKSTKGTVTAQWMVNGVPTQIELEPVFCANCGHPHGYVPVQYTSFTFWLCDKCFEEHGQVAGTYVNSDQVFWSKVESAMLNEYGRVLTKDELQQLGLEGWGRLSSLVKESPYINMGG